MGNGQSSSDTNVPSSHSFLSNKISSAKTKSKVIVVKQRTNAVGSSCSKNDDMIKRFLVSSFSKISNPVVYFEHTQCKIC